MMNHEEFKVHIATVPLLESCVQNEAFLKQLYAYSKLVVFREGMMIIQEGREETGMYIGISGLIEIYKKTRSGDLFTLKPAHSAAGVSIGEFSLIGNEKRSATVIAISKSQFYRIEKTDFDSLCQRFPEEGIIIMRKLVMRMAGFLRETNENMLALFDALVDEVRFS